MVLFQTFITLSTKNFCVIVVASLFRHCVFHCSLLLSLLPFPLKIRGQIYKISYDNLTIISYDNAKVTSDL